jgi:hemophore-related protein
LTNVAAGVDVAITGYLLDHPDVNNFLSSLQGQNKDSVRAQANDYFQANPQVKAELDAVRAPSVDLRNRCGIPAAAIILGVL